MKCARCLIVGLFSLLSLGAGPVWYEPAAQTGEAIEKAISDAYKDPRGRVFLPGGTYRINRTINLHGLGPLLIEGANEAIEFNEWNHPSSVKLEWHGPPGQAMIRLDTIGLVMRNIMIDGRGLAAYGILLVNSPQPGSALNRLEDVNLRGFTTACYQAGEDKGDGNCADCFFDRVWFANAPSGFRSVNDQSVNNHFYGCTFGQLECALDIQRGGQVTAINGSAMMCDLLVRLVRTGHNAGAIHIGPFKIERAGYKNKYMSLVDAQPTRALDWGMDSGQIRLVSVRMGDGMYPNVPDNVETPLFRIGPGALVTCDGCLFKQQGDTGQWPIAYVQGSRAAGGGILRSRDTIWMGDLKSIICNEFGHVEVSSSPTGNGLELPNFNAGKAAP